MTRFGALTRTLFRVNFDLGRFLGTGRNAKKGKKILILAAILYAALAYFGSFGFLFYSLAQGLSQIPGMSMDILLVYVFLYSLGITFLLVFFRADVLLFRLPDYDILGPLPLRPREIVFAKSLILMIGVYGTALFACAPILFAYYSFATPGIGEILLAIPVFLATPLVPAVIFAFLAYGIKLLTSRLPHRKAINTILMFAFFLAIMVGQFAFGFSGENPLLGQVDFLAALRESFPPAAWFVSAFGNGDLLAAFLFVLVGVAAFAGFIFLLSRSIVKTNSRARNDIVTSQKKAPLEFHRSSAFGAILRKEWRTFLGIQIYVFNVGFGPIIVVLAALASLIFRDQILTFLAQELGGVIPVHYLLLGFLGFTLSMIYTTAISLSLEGKKFWILKSSPVSPSTVMDAKMAFNVLLAMVPTLLAVPLFAIGLGLGILDAFVILLEAFAFVGLTTVVGALVNLRFPRFEFSSETEIVKQSLGAMIGVFGGFGIVVAEGFAFISLSAWMDWKLALLIVAVLTALAAWALRRLVLRMAENLFIGMPA